MKLNKNAKNKFGNLGLILFVFILFISQFLWFKRELLKEKEINLNQKGWQNELMNEVYKDFKFQAKIEGQKVNPQLSLYSVRTEEYITYIEFNNKYSCVFHLAEIGCNECYIHEFDIIREVIKNPRDIRRIAVVTDTHNEEFVMKLIKDYASDFDVYQVENSFFEKENKTEAPFFMQLSPEGVCYNVHKSSKINQKLTYLYVENLKDKL